MICDTDFEAALDENPKDWTTRLIYADWLTEHGKDREAYCQRWLVENRRCCKWTTGIYQWNTYSRGYATRCRRGHWFELYLRRCIFRWLAAEKKEIATHPYASRQAAEDDLAQALQLAKHSKRKS